MEYKSIFICCSSKDNVGSKSFIHNNSTVANLRTALEEKKIQFKIDNTDGFENAKDVVKAIKECQVFLFISSANSNSSEKCISEVSTAKSLNKEILVLSLDDAVYNDRIILLLSSLDKIDYRTHPEHAIELIITQLKTDDLTNVPSIDDNDSPKQTIPPRLSIPRNPININSRNKYFKHFKFANKLVDWINRHLAYISSTLVVALIILIILCWVLAVRVYHNTNDIFDNYDKIEQIEKQISNIEEGQFELLVSSKNLITVSRAYCISDSEVRVEITNNMNKPIQKIYLEDGYMHYLGQDYDMQPIETTIEGHQTETIVLKLNYRSSCNHKYDELSFNSGTLWVEFSDGDKYETNKFTLTVDMSKKN